jgi:hypothetical protein
MMALKLKVGQDAPRATRKEGQCLKVGRPQKNRTPAIPMFYFLQIQKKSAEIQWRRSGEQENFKNPKFSRIDRIIGRIF